MAVKKHKVYDKHGKELGTVIASKKKDEVHAEMEKIKKKPFCSSCAHLYQDRKTGEVECHHSGNFNNLSPVDLNKDFKCNWFHKK